MAIIRAHFNRACLVDGHEGLFTGRKVTTHLPQIRQEKAALYSVLLVMLGAVGWRDGTHFKHREVSGHKYN